MMVMSSQQNASSNRRDSLSIKELLNSQIEGLNEKLSKSQQDLNMAQNQLMALTRSSKREIEQLREQAQEGQEAQENIQSLLTQSDSIQADLDKKTLALESAQSEMRQLQLQLIEEQSKTTQKTALNPTKDHEMSISELNDALSTPVSQSALNMSSNSKLLAEISRLMAMIHRLRADRDDNLGRAHFSETELKFSQELHQKDLQKHEKELSDLMQTRNELTEELKNSRITSHEYEQQVKKLAVDLEQVQHELKESTEALERSLNQAKVLMTDMEHTDTQHLIRIDAAAAQYKALQDSYSGHRDRIIELETALKASQEEAHECKEDLQDWQEHHLTLQEGAVGIIERLQERLDESREKLRSVEVNYGIAQDRIQSLTTDFDNDRAAYEARIDEIDAKFDAALESEHERARFTDSRLTQLTDMSNTIRENFNQTRLKHSEEIKNLRNEHAIELSRIKQTHEDNVEDRNRQVETAIQIHEDHHAGIINDLQSDVRRLNGEKDESVGYLAQKEQEISEIKAQHGADIEQLKSEKQQEFDEACKKFDEKLIELERRSIDAEALGEVMIDDAKHKQEYHSMEIQYEQRIRELLDELHAAKKARDLESKLNKNLENVVELQNTSAVSGVGSDGGNSTLGNSTLKNFFEQSANQPEQSMRSSVGNHDTLNSLFRERSEPPSQSFSREVVDLGGSSEDELTPNNTLQSNNNTINNSLFATGMGMSEQSMDQAPEQSMSNESVRDYLTESAIGNEILDQTEHGIESFNSHPDRSVTDHSKDISIPHLFTERQPTHDELLARISQLEQQLHDAIVDRDEKLNEAMIESEKRIRILYEEFKKAELENVENGGSVDIASSNEKYKQLLHSIETDYITNEVHESKLQAMAEVIFTTKQEYRIALERVTELQNQLAKMTDEHTERAADLQQQLASISDTRSERVKELEAELANVNHAHSENIAKLQQQLTHVNDDHTAIVQEFDGYRSQKDVEMESEKQITANIETELEVLRQDRINDNLKLEEVTTLLEKITHEYEHKQEELNRLIDTHDGEVEYQKQLLVSSNEQTRDLTVTVEELESKLRGAEEGRNEVDDAAYEELKEEHKELSRELKALQEEREQFTQQLDSSTKLIEESRGELSCSL